MNKQLIWIFGILGLLLFSASPISTNKLKANPDQNDKDFSNLIKLLQKTYPKVVDYNVTGEGDVELFDKNDNVIAKISDDEFDEYTYKAEGHITPVRSNAILVKSKNKIVNPFYSDVRDIEHPLFQKIAQNFLKHFKAKSPFSVSYGMLDDNVSELVVYFPYPKTLPGKDLIHSAEKFEQDMSDDLFNGGFEKISGATSIKSVKIDGEDKLRLSLTAQIHHG